MKPPRYGVSLSCLPLWRRCRHDCSPGDVGPWRRLYDDPERARAGFGPSDGLHAGARPAGRVGRGLRPVGPVAASQGRCRGFVGRSGGPGGIEGSQSAGRGPLRACADPGSYGRVYPPGHAAGQSHAVRGAQDGPALASHPAAGGGRAGLAGLGDAADTPARDTCNQPEPGRGEPRGKRGRKQINDQGACGRAAGATALPNDPSPGRQAGSRGGEP